MLDETFTDGFLVLHRGHVVYERYLNGMSLTLPTCSCRSRSPSSPRSPASSPRRVRSTCPPTSPRWFPHLVGTSFDGATVQHLLDMRTGTRFDEDYDNPEADVRTYERVYLWRPDDGKPRPVDALSYYATLVNDGEHGGPFRYRSILTDVLGWVVERAGGARLHELISTLVWAPVGAEYDAEITLDAHGNAMADGGMCATLRDLARFGALYLAPGRLSAEWLSDTVRGAPDGAAVFASDTNPHNWPPGAHYRNCWWVFDPSAPW